MPAFGDRAEAADGDRATPRETTSSYSTRGGRRRRSNRQQHGNRSDRGGAFKGPLVGYETATYDTSRSKSGDAFETTTRKLAEYIAGNPPSAGEFLNAMNPTNLGFEPIEEPEEPDDVNNVLMIERWKSQNRRWEDKTEKRAEATRRAFTIVIAQGSDTLRDKMRTYDIFNTIHQTLDLIGLLKLVRRAMYSGTATSKTTLTYLEAETGLLIYVQGRNTTNSRYLEIF